MTSALAVPPAVPLLGSQRPRIFCAPPSVSTELGKEAVELAASAGLVLDDWQAWFLEQALAEREQDRWAAFEAALLVSRQNGKGAILEAMELAGLYLLDEQLILHSAHEYKTAAEGFLRIRTLIDSSDDLRRRVLRIRTSHGEEGIEFRSGQRLRFIARSGGSGRGFSGDRVILDEAQNLPDSALEALMPTMSARPNPQLVYTFTAPDRDLAPCAPAGRLRKRALRGGDAGLVYAEWSIEPHEEFCPPDCRVHDEPGDVRSWAKANPGLQIRIAIEHVAREFASLGDRGFGRERLGVGNWPVDEDAWQVISEDAWRSLSDLPDPARGYPGSQLAGPVAFAADVTPDPDRSYGSIAAAGRRPDGLLHVEVVEHRPRTGWMVERLLQLHELHPSCGLVIDGAGPAGSLIAPLQEAGFEIVAPAAPPPAGKRALLKPSAQQMAQACGALYEAATDTRSLRHLDQPEVASALAGAQRRVLGDPGAWAWARKGTSVDISPLVAVTLAAWGHASRAHLYEAAEYDVLSSIY